MEHIFGGGLLHYLACTACCCRLTLLYQIIFIVLRQGFTKRILPCICDLSLPKPVSGWRS